MKLRDLKSVTIVAGCKVSVIKGLLDFGLLEAIRCVFSILDKFPNPSDLGVRIGIEFLDVLV